MYNHEENAVENKKVLSCFLNDEVLFIYLFIYWFAQAQTYAQRTNNRCKGQNTNKHLDSYINKLAPLTFQNNAM